jgi:predicted nucleic acid-binding protein
MNVVANTTPLISLASIGQLDLLRQLFGTIAIPSAVYLEIKAKPSFGFEEVEQDWIKVLPVTEKADLPMLLQKLDLGEAETLLLARELGADRVLVDEMMGFQVAKSMGLVPVRTLSMLLAAKQNGFIPEIKPLLEEMVIQGRWYSNEVCQTILEKAGEL